MRARAGWLRLSALFVFLVTLLGLAFPLPLYAQPNSETVTIRVEGMT